jgi:hypothetical protein
MKTEPDWEADAQTWLTHKNNSERGDAYGSTISLPEDYSGKGSI